MPEDLIGQLGKLWTDIRKKATETVSQQEVAYVRGKIAGVAVHAPDGTVLVESGHKIDDEAIRKAALVGRLHALASAVVTAQAQDLKEKATEFIESTPEGKEARAVDSVDDFIEARKRVGRYAMVDVTDIRGEVVVAAGTKIDEPEVHRAREAGLLSALIYSADLPQPPRKTAGRQPTDVAAPPQPQATAEAVRPEKPAARRAAPLPLVTPPGDPKPAPKRRAPLPLVTPPEQKKADE